MKKKIKVEVFARFEIENIDDIEPQMSSNKKIR